MDVIAVNNLLPTDQVGAIVYSASSGLVTLEALHREWDARGLDLAALPSLPTIETALRRAVMDQVGALSRTQRRRAEGLKDGGFAIYDVHVDKKDLDFAPRAVVRLDENERLTLESDDPALAFALAQAFTEHKRSLAPEDMQRFFLRMLLRHDAVSLRPHGSIYFVPRPRLAKWQEIAEAIRTATSGTYKIYEIPALDSNEALEAVFDAISGETVKELELTEATLDKHLSGEDPLGRRALDTQLTRLSMLRSKLTSYEALLNRTATALGDRLEAVRANITLAAAALESSASEAA